MNKNPSERIIMPEEDPFYFHNIERALLLGPNSVEELLCLLKRLDRYLSNFDRGPILGRSDMVPTQEALRNLTKHPDEKVQVAAVACLVNVIKYISSPHFGALVPFPMEEIFEPVVDALARLDDISSPLFAKRLSILEYVAACKPFMVMMLGFDQLIVKMFKSFLNSVRNDHPKAVVSGMQTIMSFLLEVSDHHVVKDRQLVPLILEALCVGFLPEHLVEQEIPAGMKLADGVYESCASEKLEEQLEQYMAEMVVKDSGRPAKREESKKRENKLYLSMKDMERALLEPPKSKSVEQLLGLLKDLDCYLSNLERDPIVGRFEVMRMVPTQAALRNLTKHPDEKVQVAAVACLVILIRNISSEYQPPYFVKFPAPFDRMEEIFEPVVDALARLDDTSSPLFAKRLSILEYVAACKPFMVMMLDFDQLIVKMFKSFLNSVRDDHPKAVVSGMETIMSFVLHVSDHLVVKDRQLVPLILEATCAGFRSEHYLGQRDIPAGRKLADGVYKSCASEKLEEQLQQYMTEVVYKERGSLPVRPGKKVTRQWMKA